MASSMKNSYKLMTNPNPYSRITCAAYGCDMKRGTNTFSEIKMFSFPRNPFRRRRWELATRRANWKSNSRSRLCSKHFITGRPSKDPTHPDYIPSIFVFNKNSQNLKSLSRNAKSKTRRKILATESSETPDCYNSSSHEGENITSSCVIKGFCSKCFSSESVSSAFSLTLAQIMLKLTNMEQEREQLRNELALCRGEIHQLRKAHQHCMKRKQSISIHSKPNSSVLNLTDVSQSMYSAEPPDAYDPDLVPSQFLEQIYQQPDETIKSGRKKKAKSSGLESEGTSESPKGGKSSDTSSPITIVYLKR